MTLMRVIYAATAAKQIRSLPPSVKKGVRMAVDELKVFPLAGKPLRDELEGLRSHRYKRYRVVYRLDENRQLLEIVFVGSRENVYDLLAKSLGKI